MQQCILLSGISPFVSRTGVTAFTVKRQKADILSLGSHKVSAAAIYLSLVLSAAMDTVETSARGWDQ